MVSWWGICGLLLLAGCIMAQRIDQETMMSPRAARERDRDTRAEEPSCDTLKAIWRFSKRQSRAPEILNKVSPRDPLMLNEWPAFSAVPRAAPRFRYQYPSPAREAYGRVLTKAPPNVVRTPDYDEQMYGMLNAPHTSGKILRYPGPSGPRGPSFMVPSQRNKFETLKKMVRAEYLGNMQRTYEADHKKEINDIFSGRGDDNAFGNYGEQESRGYQNPHVEYPADEPLARQQHNRKPQSGNRQISQFSRYSDAMVPPSRRSMLQPYFDLAPPVVPPYF